MIRRRGAYVAMVEEGRGMRIGALALRNASKSYGSLGGFQGG